MAFGEPSKKSSPYEIVYRKKGGKRWFRITDFYKTKSVAEQDCRWRNKNPEYVSRVRRRK